MIPNWLYIPLYVILGLCCAVVIIALIAVVGFSIALIVSTIRNMRNLP